MTTIDQVATLRDFGQNYLMTLQDKGNPVIFTNGDNDTFPLWYNQEVEGLQYRRWQRLQPHYGTDWYIGQMARRPTRRRACLSLGGVSAMSAL